MLRYTETLVGFSEVPEEISLCINISGCGIHCDGCHSPHLWNDIGKELTNEELHNLLKYNKGISCIAFMGGDRDPDAIVNLSKWVKENTALKVCWYSGKPYHLDINYNYFDYVKIGPYKKEKGGLNKEGTNQKFYEVLHKESTGLSYIVLRDITYKFRCLNKQK